MKILLLHILMVFGVVSVLDLGHSHKCVLFSYQVMSDLFVTPWTITCQDPLSVDFLGKNTGMGCHFLLQGIFPIQRSNPCLLHWQEDSLPLSHQGSLS